METISINFQIPANIDALMADKYMLFLCMRE